MESRTPKESVHCLCPDETPHQDRESLAKAIASDVDMVVGVRPIEVGLWVQLMSRPFGRLSDPMSPYVVARPASFSEREELRGPALMLAARLPKARIREVPVECSEHSPNFLRFLRIWRRAANQRFGNLSYFFQFGLVGASGTLVNLSVLTLLQFLGLSLPVSVGLAIYVSMTTNFVLNRWVTFSYAREGHLGRQYFGYLLSSSFGAVVNYAVTLALVNSFELFLQYPQIAAVGGVLSGMVLNFFANRYFVFSSKGKSK